MEKLKKLESPRSRGQLIWFPGGDSSSLAGCAVLGCLYLWCRGRKPSGGPPYPGLLLSSLGSNNLPKAPFPHDIHHNVGLSINMWVSGEHSSQQMIILADGNFGDRSPVLFFSNSGRELILIVVYFLV